MKESGVLTGIKGKSAVVSVEKKEQCAGCGLCLFKDNGKAEFYAKNDKDAKIGDKVIIETSESGKFLGAVLAFLVPLLLIGVSVFIGLVLIKKDIWILILSAAFIAVWYGLLAILDKKIGKANAFSSKIVEIVQENQSQSDDNDKKTKE